MNNVAGAVMTVNATADSKDSKDYSLLLEIGSNDVIDNYGTIKGTALARASRPRALDSIMPMRASITMRVQF